ncbi:MAG: HEAT repeat domain-containing protein [Thermoanaerobaculia bacterium]
MPLLLTESLDATRREHAHQHIETCVVCATEWADYRETWSLLEELPEVEVPARVKAQFLQRAGLVSEAKDNVVPFHRRPAFKWLAQAAAVVVLVGGGYFVGDRNADRFQTTPATVESMNASPFDRVSAPMAIAETRVLDARSLSPEIQGRPNIANVQFTDQNLADDEITVAFDITSRWTVKGSPKDPAMVRLQSYMLENKDVVTPRSEVVEWVNRTYSDPANANPEIANALAKVLRSDEHEGVRIRAVETLTNLPPASATGSREALIEALKNDPNPAVRLKAVEALANMARNGAVLDTETIDTLRQKASQNDENLYVRVKAAEALGSMKP